MSAPQEIQRLGKVYRSYGERPAIRKRWSAANRGNRAIAREWEGALEQMLHAAELLPLADRAILDIGCGSGQVLAGFTRWGARPGQLCGVDLLLDRVEAARQNYPDFDLRCANAEQLPFGEASFDLVLLFTVFTSVLDEGMARNVAAEIVRVLKPGGAVIWYDFRYNNPYNRHVRGMTETAIRALFPELVPRLRRVTLLPPLARRLGPLTAILYPVLARVPVLRTHYLGLLRKPHGPAVSRESRSLVRERRER